MRQAKIAHPACEFALIIIALIVISFATGVLYSQFSLNHDSSWYLVSTDRFLNGGELYDDIIEINPPLAFYLTIPPVAASRLLDIDSTLAYFIYCIGLGCVSSLWCLALLKKSRLIEAQRIAFFFAIVVALIIFPMPDFGQREHLLLLLAMPFLLAQIALLDQRSLTALHQVALGLSAALGFLLKPHFLIIPAAIGIVKTLQNRNLRILQDPGYLAIAFAAIVYFLFIFWVHPAYLELIVPMAAEVYGAYGVEAKKILLRPETFALCVILFGVWRSSLGANKDVQRYLTACGASAIIYLIQFKGWSYHLLPLSVFVFLTAMWVFIRHWRNLRQDVFLAVALGFAVFTTLGFQLLRGPYESRTSTAFSKFLTGEEQSILVLSTNVWAAFPFVNEVSGRWASSYPAQWLIPGAVSRLNGSACTADSSSCAETKRILRFARQSILDDLDEYQPDIIFVDERTKKSYFGNQKFDYFDFLAEDSRFDKQLKCYERIGEAGSYGVFEKTCYKP